MRAAYASTFSADLGPWIDARLSDWDGDGVYDSMDNCPVTWNTQGNCNVTNEVAQGVNTPVLGDSCDPVPCPGASPAITSSTVVSISGNNSAGFVFRERAITDQVDFSTVGSSPINQVTFSQSADVSIPVPGVNTAFRFCQEALVEGIDCLAPGNIANTVIELIAYPDANTEFFDPGEPWHRVTMGINVLGVKVFDARGAGRSIGYGNLEASLVWNFASDNAFWNRNPSSPIMPAPDPGQYPGCAATGFTCLDGYFWLSGDLDGNQVGNTTTTINGIRVGSHGKNLEDHYYAIRPDDLVTAFGGGTGELLGSRFFLYRTLPDPPPEFRLRDEISIYERSRVMPLVAAFGRVLALAPVGGLDATSRLSTRFAATIGSTTTRWVSTAEASALVGQRTSGVLLSSDATHVLDTGVVHASVLSLGGEVGAPIASQPAGPVARTSFQAVFAGATNTLFVAGGKNASTGAVLSDIWAQTLGQPWRQVNLVGGPLGEILSAGYVATDAHLWIIDHLAINGIDTLRLLRVDPTAGDVEIYGSAPRLGIFDRFYLEPDRDGGLLLAASSTLFQNHVIAKISFVGPEIRSCLLESAAQTLVMAPLVETAGYTLALSDPLGNVALTRRDNLESSFNWINLLLSSLIE